MGYCSRVDSNNFLYKVEISWLFKDVSQQAEERLHSSERRLRMHVEQTQMAVIETDNAAIITAWNPAATLIFGYQADEAIGKNAVDLR